MRLRKIAPGTCPQVCQRASLRSNERKKPLSFGFHIDFELNLLEMAHTRTHACIHKNMRTQMHMHAHMHTHASMHTHICTHTCTSIHNLGHWPVRERVIVTTLNLRVRIYLRVRIGDMRRWLLILFDTYLQLRSATKTHGTNNRYSSSWGKTKNKNY